LRSFDLIFAASSAASFSVKLPLISALPRRFCSITGAHKFSVDDHALFTMFRSEISAKRRLPSAVNVFHDRMSQESLQPWLILMAVLIEEHRFRKHILSVLFPASLGFYFLGVDIDFQGVDDGFYLNTLRCIAGPLPPRAPQRS